MEEFIIVRGAGDIASGILYSLHKIGHKVIALDVANPTAIRRQVAFSSAISAKDGTFTIEGVTAEYVGAAEGYIPETVKLKQRISQVWKRNRIPVLVDANADIISYLLSEQLPACESGVDAETTMLPMVIIDAILAKRNLGTDRREFARIYGEYGLPAPCVIGVGPGFTTGEDVDFVIETMRGHGLGEVICEGAAFPNTGIPGDVG